MRRLMVACLLLAACGPGKVARVTLVETDRTTPRFRDYPDPSPTTTSTLASPVTTTTEAPTPTTVAPRPAQPVSRGVPRSGGCGGWEAAVAAAGDWNVSDVCTVMNCESHFDPGAENGRYKGLMQVDGGSLDGETNLAQAFALWAETRTWRRWSCKP